MHRLSFDVKNESRLEDLQMLSQLFKLISVSLHTYLHPPSLFLNLQGQCTDFRTFDDNNDLGFKREVLH